MVSQGLYCNFKGNNLFPYNSNIFPQHSNLVHQIVYNTTKEIKESYKKNNIELYIKDNKILRSTIGYSNYILPQAKDNNIYNIDNNYYNNNTST